MKGLYIVVKQSAKTLIPWSERILNQANIETGKTLAIMEARLLPYLSLPLLLLEVAVGVDFPHCGLYS